MSTRRSLRALAPIAVAMLAALALAGAQLLHRSPASRGGAWRSRGGMRLEPAAKRGAIPAAACKTRSRRGPVLRDPAGDPATRRQRSLAAAAAEPEGIGRRVRRPAARVRGDRSHRVAWASVFAGLSKRGLAADVGAMSDYGKPGEECVPAHAGEMAPTVGLPPRPDKPPRRWVLRCEGVRMHFPGGVVVSGRDRFRLDRNRDGVACGTGD